jgi:hypothetical protein
MIKRKTIFLMWVGLLAMLTSYSQTKVLPKFWERIEVGTNLIPMADSLTLQPSNLMVKYYYGKKMDKAFRVNLFFNDFSYENQGMQPFLFRSNLSFEIGHVWYYPTRPKLYVYDAIDIKYAQVKNILYLSTFSYNEFSANFSAGIKYCIIQNISLEFESSIQFGLQRFPALSMNNNTDIKSQLNYYSIRYYPINCLTFNLNF